MASLALEQTCRYNFYSNTYRLPGSAIQEYGDVEQAGGKGGNIAPPEHLTLTSILIHKTVLLMIDGNARHVEN